ncbi:Hypothetical predicted protein [Marmota monax]|uniref:Uncharacterized protein n=1 Tax=Marmota monax TaxID=9995 RepID=A0A5E4BA27_MARMO|nr:Hypothetical predicted protein [Marmota monax]
MTENAPEMSTNFLLTTDSCGHDVSPSADMNTSCADTTKGTRGEFGGPRQRDVEGARVGPPRGDPRGATVPGVGQADRTHKCPRDWEAGQRTRPPPGEHSLQTAAGHQPECGEGPVAAGPARGRGRQFRAHLRKAGFREDPRPPATTLGPLQSPDPLRGL